MKQTCSWCGRDRKTKHFSNGSADCNDCVNQQANQTLAGGGGGSLGGMNAPMGLPSHIAAMFGPGGQLNMISPGGGQVGGPNIHPPKPKKPKTPAGGYVVAVDGNPLPLTSAQRLSRLKLDDAQGIAEEHAQEELEWDEGGLTATTQGGAHYVITAKKGARSVEEVAEYAESGSAKKISLMLEYGMNEQGKPLTEKERAELQADYARLTFGSDAPAEEIDDEADAIASILGAMDQ